MSEPMYGFDPVHVIRSVSTYLNADLHFYRVGDRQALNIRVTDDDQVTELAKLLGAPEPNLRFHDGHEWTESLHTVHGVSVSISSEHRVRCVRCKP